MMQHNDPLARAQCSAREWLATVAETLGTRDRRYTYRILRAWLHALRDRLTVEGAAHFGAQLPEFLRGTFYDGWVPSRVPVRYSAEECLERVATQATIRRADVRDAMRGVSEGVRQLMSPGTLDRALGQLPKDLCELFAAERPREIAAKPAKGDWERQLGELRAEVQLLADAVATLAHGLDERGPEAALGEQRSASAVP